MTYEEYLKIRKEHIKDLVKSKIIYLKDSDCAEEIINEALNTYEFEIYQAVQTLYAQEQLHPELYELEKFIPKVKNKTTKQTIDDYLFDLNLLQSTIYEMFEEPETEKEVPSIEQCLNQIPPEHQEEAQSIIRKYIKETGQKPQYIGSGESCIAFSIGDKIVKFGSKRRYKNIPYCLKTYESIPYGYEQHMYVTDKIDTPTISENETEAMYRVLRDAGYVWVDVKSDNIGKQNNNLRILDDVDIYTVEDALAQHRKKTVLEFVSYNTSLAILEIKYLMSKDPNFTLDSIEELFPNQSTQTKENIDRIKSEFTRHTHPYQIDSSTYFFERFKEILEKKITEHNTLEQPAEKKGTTIS